MTLLIDCLALIVLITTFGNHCQEVTNYHIHSQKYEYINISSTATNKGNRSDDVKVNLNSQSQNISFAIGASTIDNDTEAVNNMNHLMIRAYGEGLVGVGDVWPSDDWYNRWERISLLGRQHYDIPRGAVGIKSDH